MPFGRGNPLEELLKLRKPDPNFLPARNEGELREHQQQRNDVSAAIPPSPSLEQEAPVEKEETFDPDRLDFSKLDELSGSYRSHLDELPERGDQGVGRKLLSVLLGYGASLGGGIGHGIDVGKQFYDRPYNEKVQDWDMKEGGLRTSVESELSRLGEEGDFYDKSQDNYLNFMKYQSGRGDANRDAGLARDKFSFEQKESNRDATLAQEEFNFTQDESERDFGLNERELGLNQEKFKGLNDYRERVLENYGDRTALMGDMSGAVPNTGKDAQNAYERILIQNPELGEVIKQDQDGEYFIPNVEEPEGGWFSGPSEEDTFGYNNKKQMRERAYRLLREALGIDAGEEQEIDPQLQQLIDQGLLEPI